MRNLCLALLQLLLVGVAIVHVHSAASTCEENFECFTPLNLKDEYGNKADDENNIVFASTAAESDKYKAGKGEKMEGISSFYDLSQSVIETAMSGGFPYDLVSSAKKGEIKMSSLQDTVKSYMGYAVAVVVGLIFIIFLPIVGFCFCCCRCCGRCGGRRVVEKPQDAGYDDKCSRRTSMVLLFIPLAIAIAGTGLMFQANQNLSKAFSDANGGELDKLGDLEIFLDNVVNEASPAILGKYNFTVEVLERELNNVGYLIGRPLKTSILKGTSLKETYKDIRDIDDVANELLGHLNSVTKSRENVVLNGDKVKTSFGTSGLNAQLSTCATNVAIGSISSNCQKLLDEMIDFVPANIPDESTKINSLNNSRGSGIGDMIDESMKAVNDIPEKVQNDTKKARSDVLNQLSSYMNEITAAVDGLKSFKDEVMSGLDIADLKDDGKDSLKTAVDYEKYRWYGGLGLAVLSAVAELFLLLSLVCGACGGSADDLPTERSGMSNCGGHFLMAGIVLTFITAWIMLLLTTLLFAVAAPVDTMVCGPVRDLSILDKLMEDYSVFGEHDGNGTWLGNKLFAGQGVDLRISDLMRDCEKGKTVYTALKLENTNFIDMGTLLDYGSKFNISKQLESLNVDFASTSLETSGLDTFLDTTGSLTISSADYKNVLDHNPSSLLSEFENSLVNAGAVDKTILSTVNSLQAELTKFQTENKAELAALDPEVESIKRKLNQMETLLTGPPPLNTRCDDLKSNLTTLNANMKTVVETAFNGGIKKFGDRMDTILNRLARGLDYAITKDLGKCTPIWNMYNDLLVKDGCTYMLGSLNAWYCAMGMTAVFLVLASFMSIGLFKHLYRMHLPGDHLDTIPSAPPTGHEQPHGREQPRVFNNKVYHADDPHGYPRGGYPNGGYPNGGYPYDGPPGGYPHDGYRNGVTNNGFRY